MNIQRVRQVGDQIADHLAAIETLFVSGAKVTLLVRHPSSPDGSRDLVMSSDTTEEAVAALLRTLTKGVQL